MRYFLFILFSLFFGFSSGQSIHTEFRAISLDQGHINDVMRDSEGFIWISTQDGLTKYNGTHFIQYNYDRKDKNSLAHNYVWSTFEDTKANIWIALFGGGLCRFDKITEKFYRYDDFGSIADHGIRRINQLDDSTLVVGTDHGLYLFDLHTFVFDSDTSFQKRQFDAGHIHTHSMEIHDSDILVAGSNGGYILSMPKKDVKKVPLANLDINRIQLIKRLSNGNYFLSGGNRFLETSYNDSEKRFTVIRSLESKEAIQVNDVSEGKAGQLLIAAEDGLFKLDFKQNEILAIPHDQPEENNLSDKVAYCIEEIEPNLKWIGTKTNIYEFSEKKKPFNHILIAQLCSSAILGMTEDREGNLWVASRKGLGRIKNFHKAPDFWEYTCYDQSTNPEMRNEYVLNIKVINDLMLVGFRRKGFAILKMNVDNSIFFVDPPKEVDELTIDGSVSNFHLDNDGYIWISTSGNGVIKWDQKQPKNTVQYKNRDGYTDVLSHNYTFGFEEVDDEWMAVATAAGISLINKKIDSTYQILSGKDNLSLSGNFIMDFHRDSKDQLWVCTDGGINKWNHGNTFENWTKNQGLPNDNIYGMLEHEGELWISSNKGLSRIENTTPLSFENYAKEDDLLNDEHNQFSFYKSKNGYLLFGGKKGITMFNPNDIQSNTIDAVPVIESFQLFNADGNSKLQNHINYTDELILNHNENFLSFDLASTSYFKPDQNEYRYQISPIQEEWIELGTRNFFSLNGLSPGRYTLDIQSSNNDGIWGKTIKSLDIVIKRPIYTRWYAWLLYSLLLLGMAYAYYRMKINHITSLAQVREDERTKIRERSARDFHDEVGSLVTKLSLLNQFLLTETPGEEKESINILNKMQSNIQRIRTGMKDFIWVLDPNKDSLDSAIIKIKEIGNDLFEHTSTKFHCVIKNTIPKDLQLNGVQRRQLILLLKEAFHNTVKHAEAQQCTITIHASNDALHFNVNDDGVGFDQSTYDPGYGIKSMNERARKMEGKINITSTKGEGTQIDIMVPTHPNGL
ncbi:MAG: triple tyrosine motif-containing protein [Bacteroidota bacterium]